MAETWEEADALAQRVLGGMDPMPGESMEDFDARSQRATVAFESAHPVWRGGRPTPGPEREDWIDFLSWLAHDGSDEGVFTASGIIAVVEKPWQYADAYAQYLAAGGVER